MNNIYTVKDVLNTRYIEGETLYNKACEYGRNDLCLIIVNRRRVGLRLNIKVLKDFKKNVHLYEETGEQQYKDKATGRYNHRLLWQGVINYIAEGKNLSTRVNNIKRKVIKEQKLLMPWRNYCYACITYCDECPISRRAGICYKDDSAFSLLCDAIKSKDKAAAVKYATIIMEAWDENN